MKVKAKGNNTNFTFDDYRNEIRTILERNKRRIKITKVLEKCGISKGNFYVFMNGGKKYKDGIISTLSFSKLDHLLNELKKADGCLTNRKMLESMSDEELSFFIKNTITSNLDITQIDILNWLESNKIETLSCFCKRKKEKSRLI